MHFRLKSFLDTEDGAVTVDWVVLTAAVVLLGTTIILSITSGTVDLADTVTKFTPGNF